MLKRISLRDCNKPKVAIYSSFDEQLNHLDDELIALTNTNRLKRTLVLHPLNSGVTRIKNFLEANQHFVERLEPTKQQSFSQDSIKIGTMSLNSGLEFENVFILDLNDSIIPNPKGSNMAKIEHQIFNMRKIFYASLNCATMNLFLFSGDKSNPSRFLQELDPEYLEYFTLGESSNSNDDDFPF
tara:strand:+ start:395 stop:946 length:552 start_codon:yes stop_codon:yes gene_type:complete